MSEPETSKRDMGSWAARLPRWQLLVLTAFAVAVLVAAVVNAVAAGAASRRSVHVLIALADAGLLVALVRGYHRQDGGP